MDERIEQMLDHKVSDTRSMIIDHAVKVEFLINGVLSRILGLYESSVSFGNSSSALTFMSKVRLLIDFNVLTKDDAKKLIAFAEIRNKFAHVFTVAELSDCPIDILRLLKKWYRPQIEITKIDDFKPLYNHLYGDVKKAVEYTLNVVSEKGERKGAVLANLKFNKILFEVVNEFSQTDDDFKNKFIDLVNKADEIYKQSPFSDDEINSLPIL
jgi:ElaB/YqjD/DUF883 family membrane-anchored ribosome-binding protein